MSCGLRDVLELERAGRPAVLLASDAFRSAAEEQSRRLGQFQPGSSTYIECNHNLSRFTPARDRYYLKGKSEPYRHDLRVQSEQLIAVLTGRLLRGPEAA